MLLRVSGALALVAAVLSITLAGAAEDQVVKGVPEGSYVLWYGGSAAIQQRVALVKIEGQDGKPALSVTSTGDAGKNVQVTDLVVKGAEVRFKVKLYANNLTFEGAINPADAKSIRGTLGDGQITLRAALEVTDLEELNRGNAVSTLPVPEAIREGKKGFAAAGTARSKLRTTKGADEKAALVKEIADLTKKAQEQAAPAYREFLKASPTSPYAPVVAEETLGLPADVLRATPAELAQYAEVIAKDAAQYGARLKPSAYARLAATLLRTEGGAKLAQKYAQEAAATPGLSVKARVPLLKTLAEAQTKAGDEAGAKATQAEVVKLDAELDKEYLATVPPFKPTKFAGRKEAKANKVAVLELFTGAQCPPCVAADVGFDGLIKSYEPKDVILLQYHLHIPGPDPLTNPDAVERFGFYTDLFPDDIGGTPSTVFSGKAQAGGGGFMVNSEAKYKEYGAILADILETSSDVALTGSAKLAGGKLEVAVKVDGLKDATDDHKLRLVLTEDNIRYVGGNGLRFHHHVVRSLFDTVKGVPVKGLKGGEHKASLELAGLKKSLADYLAGYEKTRPFPNADRPLALEGLKVVAFVQNDKTGEILQAAQFDVQ